MLTIDEIYDLFCWNSSYSDEEYCARVEKGIAEARKLRSIYPFIQPFVPGRSKSIWGPCAKVIALKSDEELVDYMHLLLEWLQDMNWPGAEIIFDRLFRIPFTKIQQDVEFCIFRAMQDNDDIWLNSLKALKEHRQWY